MRLSSVALAALLLVPAARATPARAQQRLSVLAAGSLSEAMTAMIAASGLPPDQVAPPVFGPSGVLRQRIEGGEAADILASADMAQPRRLSQAHGDAPVVTFARNRLCALAPATLGVTPATLLARMLDPAIRLATSTPGADPGGDYAWAVFARAEALRPGARAALEAKALTLVGGAGSRPLVPGHGQVQGVFLLHAADIMLGYCSGSAAVMREVPGLASIPLPDALTVGPEYGLVVLGTNPLADRLVVFIMSEQGQRILAQHGFTPMASGDEAAQAANPPPPPPAASEATPAAGDATPAPGNATALVIAPDAAAANGTPAVTMTAAELAQLPATTVTAAFATEHGARQGSFEGPLLWSVLDHAHALAPGKAAEQVRQLVLVSGQDGYTAVLALGEISPAFENKQVILAQRMDGQPLEHPRIVVPGDRRGGRGVHDVSRIAVLRPPAAPR